MLAAYFFYSYYLG